ncbi:MAG: hypothetical protein HYZ75_16650 [Elusimicrobia bacterium]|nr:hypothetical protein [Elusimicrobiota bacterium]
MGLRGFHIFLIGTALALMAFLGAWAGSRGLTGLVACSAAGLAVGLPYLYWFLGRPDASR